MLILLPFDDSPGFYLGPFLAISAGVLEALFDVGLYEGGRPVDQRIQHGRFAAACVADSQNDVGVLQDQRLVEL